jgi:hypothetical protein
MVIDTVCNLCQSKFCWCNTDIYLSCIKLFYCRFVTYFIQQFLMHVNNLIRVLRELSFVNSFYNEKCKEPCKLVLLHFFLEYRKFYNIKEEVTKQAYVHFTWM